MQLYLITLIPFTTAVIGRYPDEAAAAVILYGVHLEALGLAQYASWAYLLRNQHLAQAPIESSTDRAVTRRILLGPAVWLVAIALALVNPRPGYAVYFAVLIFYVYKAVRDRTVLR